MSQATAPPEKKAGALGWNPKRTREIKNRRRAEYRHSGSSASLYRRLLFQRVAIGLLSPFQCARCGQVAFDPIGWNGHGKPLCEPCSDPERRPA
jgi:hypothetical protein